MSASTLRKKGKPPPPKPRNSPENKASPAAGEASLGVRLESVQSGQNDFPQTLAAAKSARSTAFGNFQLVDDGDDAQGLFLREDGQAGDESNGGGNVARADDVDDDDDQRPAALADAPTTLAENDSNEAPLLTPNGRDQRIWNEATHYVNQTKIRILAFALALTVVLVFLVFIVLPTVQGMDQPRVNTTH